MEVPQNKRLYYEIYFGNLETLALNNPPPKEKKGGPLIPYALV